MRKFRWLAVAILGLSTAGGCSTEGTDPPTDRFFNPVAVAADPDGAFLLVANGDFGLDYTSATVVPVDLRRVGRRLDELNLRTTEPVPLQPPVIRDALLPELAVRIGAFAGRMRLDPLGRAAYVSTRQDGKIRAIRLVRGSAGELQALDCGGERGPLQECDAAHELTGHPTDDPDGELAEPFGFDFVPAATATDGDPAGPHPPAGLLAAYLRSGDLALFPLDPATSLPPAGGRQAAHLDLQDFASRDVAVHPDGRQAFVSSRSGEALRTLQLTTPEDDASAWKIEDRGSLDTGSAGSFSATDTRDLLVSPSGDRVFVARRHVPTTNSNQPADVVVLERTLSATGNVRLDVLGTLLLRERPISMSFWPGAGERPDLLFVLCYDAGTVEVLDVTHLVRLASVVVGKEPYEIALVPPAVDRPSTDSGRGLAYVTHFRGNEISVIDIDPKSMNWLEKIAIVRGVEP